MATTERLSHERRVSLVAQIAAQYSVANVEGALHNDQKAVAWALDLVEAAEQAIAIADREVNYDSDRE